MATPTPPERLQAIYTQLETFSRSNVTPFVIPNPVNDQYMLYTDLIKVFVVDSPFSPTLGKLPLVAMLVVPRGRESDWSYTTEQGLRKVILEYPNCARLIVLANIGEPHLYYVRHQIDPLNRDNVERLLRTHRVVLPLCLGTSDPILVSHGDDLLYAIQVAAAGGTLGGNVLVEDVQLQRKDGVLVPDLRRIMRFEITPSILHAECKLIAIREGEPVVDDLESLKNQDADIEYIVDTEILIDRHLQAMVWGLTVISSFLSGQSAKKIEAMSIGVGAGILERFLVKQFGANVLGMEECPDIWDIALGFFKSSVEEDVDDFAGVTMITKFTAELVIEELATGRPRLGPKPHEVCVSERGKRYDIVMLDISKHVGLSMGVCAPTREFLESDCFAFIKTLLNDEGALIINVIIPDFIFRMKLLKKLTQLFTKVYRINLGNELEFVLVATCSTNYAFGVPSSEDDAVLGKIKSLIPHGFKIMEI